MSQVIQTLEQQYYLSNILGYEYSIQYKIGALNTAAYALSCIAHSPNNQFLILYVTNFVFLDHLQRALHTSSTFKA